MKCTYRGGTKSMESVRELLRSRYGDEVAESYDPETDVMTMRKLNEYNLRVKSGEKAIRIPILCEKKNKEGEVVAKFPRKINLFHVKLQCEKVE